MARLLVLAALSCSAVALAEEALIWTSETTPEKATAQLAAASTALPAVGLTLAPGWPRVVQSEQLVGLKAGFHVVLIGLCPDGEAHAPLLRAKGAQRLAYVRQVTLGREQLKDASCPGIDPSIKPPTVPAYLVLETGKNRVFLEQRSAAFQQQGALTPRDGWPRVVETKTLRLAVPPGKTADKFLLVLGVCDLSRAELLLSTSTSGTEWAGWALDDVPLACPELASAGVQRAIEYAVDQDATELVLELLPRLPEASARRGVLSRAVQWYRLRTLRQLLVTLKPDAAALTALLEQAARATAWRDRDKLLRDEVVSVLLGAGATPAPGMVDAAIRSDNPRLLRLLLERGFKPSPEVLRTDEVLWRPATLGALLDAKALGLGQADDGELLLGALRVKDSLTLLVSAGASLAARGRGGLGALDVVLLFPRPDDPAREALLSRLPAFEAAWRGDVARLDASAASAPSVGGWTPLLVAAASGKTAAVKALLASGAPGDARVTFGHPGLVSVDALALSLDAGDEEAAKALLDKGAEVNGVSSWCCAFTTDRFGERFVSSRTLVTTQRYDRFARDGLGAPMPAEGWEVAYAQRAVPLQLPVLARAALLGRGEVVKALLSKGARVDEAHPSNKLTALMLAGQSASWSTVELLLARGASVDRADASGRTVLGHLVQGKPPVALVKALLEKKKGLSKGKGVLKAAALSASTEVVDALLEAGAGGGGEGKAAAEAVCDSGDANLESTFSSLQAAGYLSGRHFFGDCVQEGD